MNSPSQTTLSVSAIKDGTVIDHIAAGSAIRIISLLGLTGVSHTITLGINLASKSMGVKDLIKITGHEISEIESKIIAIIAPAATINIVAEYRLIKKFRAEIPRQITGLFICPNPGCITNHERMKTKFGIRYNGHVIHVSCSYCERIFLHTELSHAPLV